MDVPHTQIKLLFTTLNEILNAADYFSIHKMSLAWEPLN